MKKVRKISEELLTRLLGVGMGLVILIVSCHNLMKITSVFSAMKVSAEDATIEVTKEVTQEEEEKLSEEKVQEDSSKSETLEEDEGREAAEIVDNKTEYSTEKKLVALTFDDGPMQATTGRLLDILKEKNVKATFFVVGTMVQKAPELLKREVDEGHEIGSHTYAHKSLTKMSVDEMKADLAKMKSLIADFSGAQIVLARPTYGSYNGTVSANIGIPLIYWSVDPLDWKYRDAAVVRSNVVKGCFDGAIVLMHDIHATTVDAVAGIIDDLRAQGYEFLTVSELAAARGVTLQNGVLYGRFMK